MQNNKKLVFLQGNEACVHGALRAGMRFYSGYPITPSSEIAEVSAKELPKLGGKFIQMEDEISGMAAAIGASLTGVKAMTATSGPGFSLKQENIGFAAFTEVPVVIVNIMRMGPSTGLPTSPAQGDIMQARWGTHGDHPMICLVPTSVAEMYTYSIRAFNLAEKYRTPVLLMTDEVIAHMREGIEIPEEVEIIDRTKPTKKDDYLPYHVPEGHIVPPMAPMGEGYKWHITGLTHTEDGAPTNSTEVNEKLIHRLMTKMTDYYDDIVEVESQYADDADTVIIAIGSIARVAAYVVAEEQKKGNKVGMFVPKTLWPFPERHLEDLLKNKNLKNIIVAEMNAGQLVYEIERIVKSRVPITPLLKYSGEIITPAELTQTVKEVCES